MKILTVRLLNLASLSGEHVIDFTAEPLVSSGIFAITGRTGAGKSTLLDAITLALYGRAARYGSDPNPETIMSKHTGECSAEVTFEVAKGRFRAAWHLRRARGKADAKIQPATRYIYDSADQVLAQKLREVDSKIEEISGLNYDRFLRSVLLAQGDFARFLNAPEDERASLLESLTGTAIYSELSKLTHEETARRRNELDHKANALNWVELLTEEQREEIEGKRKTNAKKEAQSREQRTALSTTIERAKQWSAANQTLAAANQQRAALDARRKSAAEPLKALASHRRAAPLFPELDRLDNDRHELATRETAVATARVQAQSAATAHTGAVISARKMAEEQIDSLAKTIEQATDQKAQRTTRIDTLNDWLRTHEVDRALVDTVTDLVSRIGAIQSLRERQAREQKELKVTSKQLDERRQEIARFQEKITQTTALLKPVQEKKAQLPFQSVAALQQHRDRLTRYQTAAKQRSESEQRLKQVDALIGKHREKLGHLLAAGKAAKALLEERKSHLKSAERVAALSDHRHQLIDGEPCPLCGAESHPYAEGDGPETEISRLEKRIDEAQQSRDELIEQYNAEKIALGTAESEQKAAIVQRDQAIELLNDAPDGDFGAALETNSRQLGELEAIDQQIAAIEKDLANLQQAFALHRKELSEVEARQTQLSKSLERLITQLTQDEKTLTTALATFSIPLPEFGKETAVSTNLQTRAKAYTDQKTTLDTEIRAHRDILDTLATAQREQTQSQTVLKNLPEVTSSDSPPAFEWTTLAEAVQSIGELNTARTQATSALQQQEAEKKSRLASAQSIEQKLIDQLESIDFPTIETLRAARLESSKEAELNDLETRLKDDATRLDENLRIAQQTLESLDDRAASDHEQLDTLIEQHQTVEREFEHAIAERTRLSQQLANDDRKRVAQAEAQAALAEEKAALQHWTLLHDLIGSADGKKFRRFAQSISLDNLLRNANRHIHQLSNRYRLQRTADKGLALEIVDLHQGGSIRPMTSLSGGETFLASLALALGLSDLAGKNVQIDSLFIDEGFGSLDPETLDIAIAALEGLQANNKIVGVISHIDLLKERISTQIEVRKKAGGISDLVVTSKGYYAS